MGSMLHGSDTCQEHLQIQVSHSAQKKTMYFTRCAGNTLLKISPYAYMQTHTAVSLPQVIININHTHNITQ